MSRLALGAFVAAFLAAALPAHGAEVFFSDVRIAMEPQEGSVLVKEMFLLKPEGGADFPNPSGMVIPVPVDARGADLVKDSPAEGLSMTEGGVRVEGVIPTAGRQIGVLFLLPIRNGKMVFDQSLGAPVKLAHAALVGNVTEADLSGDGFGKSDIGETPSGLPARFVVGKDFNNGRIHITVNGLTADVLYPITVGLTIISFLVLAWGFVLWIRGRVSKDADFA